MGVAFSCFFCLYFLAKHQPIRYIRELITPPATGMASLLLAVVVFLAFTVQLVLVDGNAEHALDYSGKGAAYPQREATMPSSWLSITPSVLLSLSCFVHRMQYFTRHHRDEMMPMCALLWPSVGLLMAKLQGVEGYSQSQPKLVGSGAIGDAWQGESTAISGDGLTVCVGGYADSNQKGAVWFYTRVGVGNYTWQQQRSKIVPSNGTGTEIDFGFSCSLSFNGSIAVVGGPDDNSTIGATWIFTRNSRGVWVQRAKHVGTGCTGKIIRQGSSIALASTAANVYVTGGYRDNSNAGSVIPSCYCRCRLFTISTQTRSRVGVFA